jgi:signal transduction histidine kinase
MRDICDLFPDSPISTKGVSVRCSEADFPVVMVSVDPDQVKEVILNLVINAVEATAAGGTVELSATRGPDYIAIHVKDNGVGIPEEQLQQVFDPFYTTKPDGTGLGLSIAHQIMDQHGGTIEVNRNPDRGMTFSLIFPLTEGEKRES